MGFEQPVEVLDERGLTRPVLAKNGQELAPPDGEVYALERDDPVRVAVGEPLDLDHRLSVTLLPLRVGLHQLPVALRAHPPPPPLELSDPLLRRQGQLSLPQSHLVEEAGDLQRHDAGFLQELYVSQDFSSRPVGDYLAFPKNDYAVGVEGLLGLVLDDDEGDVVAVFEVFGDLEDAQFSDGVEVRGRLVQAKNARLDGEHRSYGEALLLATGEGGRRTVLEPFEAHLAEHALDAPDHLLTLHGEVLGPEGDLKGHVRREELGLEVLEDEAYLLGELADPPLAGGSSPDAHLPLHLAPEEVGDQTVQGDTERALPRPRWPHHDHELPLGHFEVNPIERGLLLSPVTVDQPLDANLGFHLSCAPPIREEYDN